MRVFIINSIGPPAKQIPQTPVIDTVTGNDKTLPGIVPTPCPEIYKSSEQHRIIIVKRDHHPAAFAKEIYHFHNRLHTRNKYTAGQTADIYHITWEKKWKKF
ncbi:MAG: hypothetical protein LBP23_08375 [Treponema sp.]|jgi:hypothetical protein|nr:hypothetical protein [Treponema sp.]